MTIFAVVATALAGVLTSSISARSLASQRTAAEQIANDQLEWIRSLDYDDVGCTTTACPVTGGIVDPNGNQAGQGGPTVPAAYSVTVMITWVDDSVPTAHRTYKNYKNVTVTVTRVTGSKQMAQQSTQVGPRQRAFLGGINKGTVIVQVNDYLSPKAPHPGVVVNLMNGPSSPLSDTTDAGGTVTFPGLDPASGSTYYDIVVPTFGGGWIALPDAAATHFQLSPGGKLTKPIQVYKPVTLTFQPQNSDGTPFSSAAVFTVTGPEGTDDFTYNQVAGSPITVTSLTKAGVSIPLPPGTYTITPKSGMYADPVVQDVPSPFSSYPGAVNASVNVVSDPLGSISATVSSGGGPVVGATVTVNGGPRSLPTQSATTNASGIATFPNLPAGSGYTVTAAKGSQSAPNQSASVSGGSTTNLTFDFPLGSLKAVVTWAGVKVVGATVTLTGGPTGVSLSGTSDVNGEVLFSNIPAGSGYTMNAVQSGQTGTASPTVVGGTTTTVPVAMPTLSLVATVTWVGANVTGAQVTLSGGPMSLSPLSATTTGSGQVTFSNVPAGAGYTLAATKNGQTTTLTSQSFTTSPTTSIGLALPSGTIAVNAATWAGQPAGNATVTISGGPNSPTTYTGTTNASGVANVTVPATTSTYPYTVTVTDTAGTTTGTGTATVTSLASGATATVSPALTPTGTIAVTATWAGQPAGSATVTISGGPNSPATYTGTTSTSGTVNIVVPITNSSFPYTVTVTKAGGTGTATVTSLASGATAPATPALTPTKTLTLTIQAGGTVQKGKAITLSITGGPNGTAGAAPTYGGAFTTNASTGTIAVTLPAGSGNYTVKAYVTGCTGTTNRSNNTGTSVSAAAATTTATINMTSSTCLPPLP